MRAQFHAAVAALFVALVTILIAILGLQFVAVRATAPATVSFNVFAAPVWLLQMVLTLLTLGYVAGIIAWLATFAAHRSGVHRLAAAQTWIARR